MKIKPLNDNVLLEIVEQEKEVGIILPDQYDDETSVMGRILELGVDCPKTLKKGDEVLFKKHLFDEVVIGVTEKKVYLLGKAEHITAIII